MAYGYQNNYWSAVEVKNETRDEVEVELNCSKSENVTSNGRNLINGLKIRPNKSKILLFLAPENSNRESIVKCNMTMREL